MEGKREEGIRKGPWKSEEDEVLISHVSKYGPRDWSSIRSKGLLQRTGKSCRLRWVNKLRPNLKNGCKFSLEEERVVIELQAEFGNKWARIATYLPGRTDNDVKNFWSSRQKRLARILHNSQTSSSSPTNKSQKQPLSHDPLISEVGVLSSPSEGESSSAMTIKMLNDDDETIRMVSLPDLFGPRLVRFDEGLSDNHHRQQQQEQQQQRVMVGRVENETDPQAQQEQRQQQLPELGFSSESHEILGSGLDPYYDAFEPRLDIGPEFPLFAAVEDSAAAEPDCFFDDFPVDMFDHIEPLPSPSEL